jgi:hypothetical protein
VHLGAYATANLDIMELITDQSPDANGNKVPAGVQEGSLIFHSAAGMQKPMSLNVNVGLFNVVKGTCTYSEIYCDGYCGVVVDPDSDSVAPLGEVDLGAQGEYYDGTLIDFQASWSTSNSGVATVSNGIVTGVTAGSVTITASVSNLPVCGYYYGYNPICAELQIYETFTGSASITVVDPTPTITQILETSPVNQVNTPSTPFTVGTPTTIQITGTGFGSPNCPTVSFPTTTTYTTSSCTDTSFNVNFTPTAVWTSGTLTVTCSGYNGQSFEPSGGLSRQSCPGLLDQSTGSPDHRPREVYAEYQAVCLSIRARRRHAAEPGAVHGHLGEQPGSKRNQRATADLHSTPGLAFGMDLHHSRLRRIPKR